MDNLGLTAEDFNEQPAQDTKVPDLGGHNLPVSEPVAPVDSRAESHNAQAGEERSSLADGIKGAIESTELGKTVASGVEGVVLGVREKAREIGRNLPESMQSGDLDSPLTPYFEKPESTIGKVASSLTTTVAGFFAARAAGVANAVAASVVGTGLTVNPHEENLANTLSEYPMLEPIFEKLAHNPTDSVTVSTAKAMALDLMANGAVIGSVKTASGVFSMLHYSALRMWEKVHGPAPAKMVDQVEKEAAEAVASLSRESPESASVAAGNGKHIELDSKSPSSVITMPGEKESFEKVSLKNLKVKDSDHTGPMNPDKVLSLKAQLETDPSKVPAIVAERRIDGDYIVDGRHRHAAMMATGAESSTVKIIQRAEAKLYGTNGEAIGQVKGPAAARISEAMDRLVMRDTTGLGNTIEGNVPNGVQAGTKAGAATAARKGMEDVQRGVPNPEYLDTSNNTLATLEVIGKEFEAQLQKVQPEYRSVGETRRLAAIAVEDPDEFAGKLAIMAGNMANADVIALGARQVVLKYGDDLFKSAKAHSFQNTPESKAAYEAAVTKLSEFQANLQAVTTGMGRGLRSFAEKVGTAMPKGPDILSIMKDEYKGQTLLKAIAASDGDAEKINMIVKLAKMGGLEKAVGTHNEYWIGLGLLSRISTQVVNLGSTGVNTLMQPAVIAVGHAERLDWKSVKNSVRVYNGLRQAVYDSAYMAYQAFKQDRAIISQAGTMEQKLKFISSYTWGKDPDTIGGRIIDGFGELTRLSFRGLTAGDEFFKQLNYRAKVAANASDEAMDLVRAGKLEKSQIQKFVKDKVDASFNAKGEATSEAALRYAEKAAFVQDLKVATYAKWPSVGELAASMAGHPVLRGTLLPFVKTPTNVLRNQFEYTPVIGQLRREFWDNVVNKGGEEAASSLGKMTVGLGLTLGIGYAALEGRFTGAPPSPGITMPEGWKPYSVVIFDDNGNPKRWIPYDRMQPWGGMVGIIVDALQLSGRIDGPKRDNTAAAIALSLANNLINKNYLRSLTEFTAIFGGYNAEAKLERWMDNKAASYYPGMFAQFNPDDSQREVRSMLDAMMAKDPWLSQKLRPKADYLGHVKPVPVGLPFSLISPSAVSEAGADPVMKELSRLSVGPAQMKTFEPDQWKMLNGTKIDLKDPKYAKDGVLAYDRMVDLIQTVKPLGESKTFYKKLQEVMKDPRYIAAKDQDVSPELPGLQVSMIKAVEAQYRQAAYQQMVREYRDQLGLPRTVTIPEIEAYDKANRKLNRVGEEVLRFGNQ